MKQILTTIAFLKLPDHAPDQPFPVSAAAGQSQPAEFFCPEPMSWTIDAPNLSGDPAVTGYTELAPGESKTVTERIFVR